MHSVVLLSHLLRVVQVKKIVLYKYLTGIAAPYGPAYGTIRPDRPGLIEYSIKNFGHVGWKAALLFNWSNPASDKNVYL